MQRMTAGPVKRLGRVMAAAVALAAVLTIGAPGAAANTKGEHCFNPGGDDLNQTYGVAHSIVAGRFCAQLRAGEHWAPSTLWIMATTFEQVPPDFVPAGATPLDDLRAKLLAVRYVVDAGTAQERTYSLPSDADLWTGTLPSFGDLPAANTVSLGALHPLSKGSHTIDRYWVFKARHCDGLGTEPGQNCLPAGATWFGRIAFDVAPASH